MPTTPTNTRSKRYRNRIATYDVLVGGNGNGARIKVVLAVYLAEELSIRTITERLREDHQLVISTSYETVRTLIDDLVEHCELTIPTDHSISKARERSARKAS